MAQTAHRDERVPLAGAGAADTPDPSAGPLAALTARESEVLAWVTRGLTNRDVAAMLCLSARTVQKHLEHIYQKLGVETRTAAAARVWSAAGERAR